MSKKYTKNVSEIKSDDFNESFIKTGFFEYDNAFQGLQNGEFVFLAGRVNIEITSFCVNIAVIQATENRRVLYICDDAELPNISKMIELTLEKRSKQEFGKAIDFYSGEKNSDYLFNYCLKKEFNYDLIIVDKDIPFTFDCTFAYYPNIDIEYEASILKKIAKMCNIPVVKTGYTNRLSGTKKQAEKNDILNYSRIYRHLESIWLLTRKELENQTELKVYNDFHGSTVQIFIDTDEL